MNPSRAGTGATSQHLPVFVGKHDRFCVWCGGLIPRQNQQKTVTCPNAACKRALPLRRGTWMQSNVTGMGRCPICDSFVHKTFMYCQNCRNANEEGLAKRNESNERALKDERESNKRLKMEVALLKRRQARFMEVDGVNAEVGSDDANLSGPGASGNVPGPSGGSAAASAGAATDAKGGEPDPKNVTDGLSEEDLIAPDDEDDEL